MFPRRLFAGRLFPPRLFPQSLGITAVTPAFLKVVEREDAIAYFLFALTVTHPTPKTWYLATANVTFGGRFYQALVLNHSGMAAAAALAGVGGASGITLTLTDGLDISGPRRRFSDAFAAPVPGYSEPYDLLTATLEVSLIFREHPTEALIVGSALYLQPGSFVWEAPEAGAPPTLTLTFEPDQRRYEQLPKVSVSTRRYPHAPDSSVGRPVALWFGRAASELRVPLLALDPDGALFLIGASPTATPLGGVSKLWTIRQEPGSETPSALPVRLTTAGESVFALTTGSTDLNLKQAAQRFELDGDGAFVYAVKLRLARVSGSSAAAGSITVAIVLDQDGLPGTELVDQAASAEIDASIVTTGTMTDYTVPFQSNNVGRAPFLPGGRGLWLVVKFAKIGGGDLETQIESPGTYPKGILAKQSSSTDDEWLLSGKQQRRGPVRQDFTGGGHLRRDVATGTIVTRPPVSVPGH